jgi:ABC-type glycerol-3-phosphate transport system substrate-binding protein
MRKQRTRRQFLGSAAKLGIAAIAGAAPFRLAAQPKSVTTITLWHWLDPNSAGLRQGILKQQIADFEKANPDIKVKVEVTAAHGKQMIEGVLVKQGPDVASVFSPSLTRPVKSGAVESLNPYIKSVDTSDWIAPWSEFAVYNGEKMGIPWEHRVWVLMGRKEALAKKGLAMPTNWAELAKVAGSIGPQNPMGFAMGLATKDDGNWIGEFIAPAIWSNGGEIFDAAGKPAFNSPQGAQVLEALADMISKHKGSSRAVLGWGYSEVHESVKSGAATIGLLGSARFREIRTGAPDLVMQHFPAMGSKIQTQVDGHCYVMGKFSQNKQAAWRFIDFMTNPAMAAAVAKGGSLPARKSAWNDPWFKTAEAADLVQLKEYAEKYGRWLQLPETWPPMQVKFAEAAQKVILTNMQPKAALDEVAAWYNANKS